MDDGWETARNPNRPPELKTDPATGLVDMPGAQEWSVLRLAAVAGSISELHIDTAHFRGNYPESVLVESCDAPHATSKQLMGDGVEWRPLLERVRLGPDELRKFAKEDLVAHTASSRATHIRVTMLPDGGIMRVRAFGEAVEPMPEEA